MRRIIRKERLQRFELTAILSLIVMVILLLTLGFVLLLIFILDKAGVLYEWETAAISKPFPFLLLVTLLSLAVGAVISYFGGMIPLKPVNRIINTINRLADGDYSARLNNKGVFAFNPTAIEFTESFNKMASELESTEILRSDFINSFSHEFKTPIVSIAGFAGLLKQGGITPEEEREYLGIIESESLRLADMATNALYITKLENQNILTGVSEFNVSEQIRSCILILENRWSAAELEIIPDFEDYSVYGNMEMLHQVWINLLDNAIKFSPKGGTIAIAISQTAYGIDISFTNYGPPIPPEKLGHIFQKYYQVDDSHSTAGYGMGLAIVERIVALHEGDITVSSSEEYGTVFHVMLPEASKI